MNIVLSTRCSVAQLAVGEQRHQPLHQRVVEVVEPLEQHQRPAPRQVAHLGGLGGVAGERLLGQDVLPGEDRRPVPGRVQAVGERVVDRLDLGIGDHVGVRRVDPLDAVGLGERLGPVPVTRGDRDESRPGGRGGADDGQLADAGRPQHSDPQWFHDVGHSRPADGRVSRLRT